MKSYRFRKHRSSRDRRGSTLVEVMAATIVTSLVLVASMRLLHKSHLQADRLDVRATLEHLAASEVSRRLASLGKAFQQSNVTGSFTDHGHGDCHYVTVCSDDRAIGGEPKRLMAVFTTVWHDTNNDQKKQDSEPTFTLAVKYAKVSNE